MPLRAAMKPRAEVDSPVTGGLGEATVGHAGLPATAVLYGHASWTTRLRRLDVWVALAAMVLIGWVITPDFLTAFNLRGLLNESGVIGVLAIGQFVVVLSGGFDLSVAGVVGLGSVSAAWMLLHFGFVGGLIALPICGALGLVNGLVVTGFGVSPFIATLGMDGVGATLALQVSSSPIAVTDKTMLQLAVWHVGFVPLTGFVWVGVAAVLWLLFDLTPVGTHIAAIGGRESTARLSGIKTVRVRICVYALSGVLAGLGGWLFVVVSSSGDPTLGTGWELLTIAMVVIGGSELYGGSGFLPNVVAGTLIYETIIDVLNLVGVDPNLQSIFSAIVIVIIVAVRVVQQR